MSLIPNDHRSGLFVRASLEAVARSLISWRSELGHSMRGERKSLRLHEAWSFVDEARSFSPSRAFLVAVGGQWTAFFNNQSREFLAAAEMFVMCQRLKVDTCFFSYDHSVATPHCGSAKFSFSQLVGGHVVERQVMLSKESGWKFTQFGDPLPFEDLAAYALPKKRERLTPELLQRYGHALGIPFWDSTAYGDTVYLLQWTQGTPNPEAVIKKAIDIFGPLKAILQRPR